MNEKYAIFDLDGTLVETTKANNYAYARAIHDVCSLNIAIPTERLTHHNLASLYRLTTKQLSIIQELKNTYYSEYLTLTHILPCIDILLALQKNGHNIILLTNGKKDRIEQVLRFHHIYELFDSVFFFENYDNDNKYTWLLRNRTEMLRNIICFENEPDEAKIAIRLGISPERIFLTNNNTL